MAAVGAGDPRWIVESRADGRNVGNWHWTEVDYTTWAAKRMAEELAGLVLLDSSELSVSVLDEDAGGCVTTGEVSVSTRKGKVITFYELNCTLKWFGTHVPSGEEGEGTIQMPYISEENDYDDFEVIVSASKDTSDGKFKSAVRTAAIPLLKERVPRVLVALQEHARAKQLLPAAGAGSPTPSAPAVGAANANTAGGASSGPNVDRTTLNKTFKEGSKHSGAAIVSTSSSDENLNGKFEVKDRFNCRPIDLWECLVDPNRVRAYAGGDSQITAQAGGQFSLFGGAVSGEIVSADAPNKLVQKWRAKDWPVGHFSTVVLELTEEEGQTVLTVNQRGVPESDLDRTRGGWYQNYFVRIKGIFGYGGVSF